MQKERLSLPLKNLQRLQEQNQIKLQQINTSKISEQKDKLFSPRDRLDRLKFKKISCNESDKIPQKNQQGQILLKNKEQNEQQICLLHSAPADLVCITDGQLICAKCALFGSHKGHNIDNKQGIIKKLTHLTQNLLPLYENLKQLQQKSTGQKFKKQWTNKLNQKKSEMSKQVINFYQQIIKQLQNLQDQNVKKINEYYQVQQKILNQYIKTVKSNKKLSLWFEQIQELPNIIEQLSEKQKMQLNCLKYLNEKQRVQQLFSEGQKIKIQINNGFDLKIKQLQCSITSFEVNFKKEYQGYLKNLCNIGKQIKNQTPIDPQKANQINSNQILMNNIHSKSSTKLIKKSVERIENKVQNSPINKNFDDDCMLLSLGGVQILFPKSFQSNSFNHNLSHEYNEHQLPHLQISNIRIVQQSYMENTKSQQDRIIFKNLQNICTVNSNDCYKRKRKLQVPEKYKGIVDDLKNDRADQVDLGGAQLGDSNILALCDYIRKSKRLRVLKLIRNKISDDIIGQLMKACSQSKISSLNLSQNLLTDKSVMIIQQENLTKIKNITLSLNKINRRNVKISIDNMNKKVQDQFSKDDFFSMKMHY